MDLPPLPIPSLNVTMDRFLKSIEALDDDPEQSKALVKEFLMNDAPKLQELLVEYDRKGRETGQIGSYVEEFWNDSYLAPDSSVVLNLNPFFVLVSVVMWSCHFSSWIHYSSCPLAIALSFYRKTVQTPR